MSGARSFREAILAQPENLTAAAAAFVLAVGEIDLEPLRHGTIVFGAIGASQSAAIPVVRALRARGRRAFLLTASELAIPGARELGDAFVLVSQSGASAETLDALDALEGAPVLAVSAQHDSPVASRAGAWLPLGPMTDTPVATLSYTATLQTLGMLGDALSEQPRDGWQGVPAMAEAVLGACARIAEDLAPAFAAMTSLDAVGGGTAEGSAVETALLVREGLRLPATGMETRQYLHGPMESVAGGLGAILFGGRRERELAATLTSLGATVALIGAAEHVAGAQGAAGVIALPEASPTAAPILQILPVQLLAERVAQRRGLPIGELRRSQPDTKVAR
jgi:glucosamine--fructose-6-phosphate aminotransferase (isomerizing)